MELMYPIAIVVSFIFAILILFVRFNKKKQYTNGKKIANSQYIKETQYYKERVKKYKILSNTIKVLSILGIVIASILVARPVKVQTISEDKYNRDILIGLDTSTSQCDVNLELVQKFRKIIPSIAGDRIGIVIFNTSPVVYCPLTDDYDYIDECLEKIEKQLKIVIENDGYIPFELEDEDAYAFWYGGVLANNEEKGSSLVGDGLARNFTFISKFKNR